MERRFAKQIDPTFYEELLRIMPVKSLLEHYELGEEKGEGGYGVVYQVLRKSD